MILGVNGLGGIPHIDGVLRTDYHAGGDWICCVND